MNFILIYSTESNILQDASKLYEKEAGFVVEREYNQAKLLIYSDAKIEKLNIVNIVNDVGDIDYGNENNFFANSHDSIATKMVFNDNCVKFRMDYLGLLPLYYYQTPTTTIIGSNIFLVSNVTKSAHSEESLWDSLIFKKPFNTNTWFSNIKSTMPNESIVIDLAAGTTTISEGRLEENIFSGQNKDYVGEAIEFFRKAHQVIAKNNLPLAVSLSAGSDSRTALAGVMSMNSNFDAYSWGADYYRETRMIKALAERFRINWHLMSFEGFKEAEEHYLSLSQLSSNGLSLQRSPHHFFMHTKMKQGSAVFEGNGGSEFLKGEITDLFYTDAYRDIIARNNNPQDYLNRVFSFFTDQYKAKIIQYIMDNYSSYLLDFRTPKGYEMYRKFMLQFVPTRAFTGLINSARYAGLNLYETFFSRKILTALFANQVGLSVGSQMSGFSQLEVSQGYKGKVKVIIPEAKMVQSLYPDLLKTQLDRGFSMKQALYPFDITKYDDIRKLDIVRKVLPKGLKRFVKAQKQKLTKQNIFRGQTDYSQTSFLDLDGSINTLLKTNLKLDYQRNNRCVEDLNVCLNAMEFVKAEEISKLLSANSIKKSLKGETETKKY